MLEKFRAYFFRKFEESSIVIKKKALLLAFMNIVIILVVIPIPPVVWLVRGDIIRPMVIAVPVFIGCIISISFLMRVSYTIAANVASLAISATVVIGVIYQHISSPFVGYSSMLYLVPTAVIFSSLFCKRMWTTILTTVFIIGDVIFFFVIMSNGVIDMNVAKTGLLDSMIALVFTYILAMLIIKINRDAVNDVQIESERNRDQYLKIKDLLNSATSVSMELSSTSEAMKTTSSTFSDSAQNQAASVEEITSTVEEVNASMDLVVRNVEQQFAGMDLLIEKINNLSGSIEEMKGMIEEATVVFLDTSKRSKAGEDTLDIMNQTMGSISESSKQMTTVVDVINRISDQISLLSLNAAIEAARAGDAGRGFAVVADEISKLAEQTSDSIKEISSLIRKTEEEVNKGIGNVKETVNVMIQIIHNINTIQGLMSKINEVMKHQVEFRRIVDEHSNDVKVKSEEIKISTGEQMAAITEVAKSISNINELTQSFSLGVISLAEETEKISLVAGKLNEKIGSHDV